MQVDRVDAHRRWRRESSAFTNEGKSQKPQRSGWTLLPLSDCGTHSVGRHAGRDLHSCCDATPLWLGKRRGLRGKRKRRDCWSAP